MFRTHLSSAIIAVSIAMAGSAASAATISHSAPRAPVEVSEATSPQSAMPYSCDKGELNTRIEKRTCR